MSALLEVEHLETAYGASQVLFGIDLAIRAGEVATLLGRNGMGKTTTVRSIMGLTRRRAGPSGSAASASSGCAPTASRGAAWHSFRRDARSSPT